VASTSVPLLLGAAAVVAILHSILPDHWVPLAVVGRTQRWSLFRVARVSALASAGHVVASVVLAGIIAAIGLQFQRQLETQQGHIVGAVLILTGVGFLIWGLTSHSHDHDHGHSHDHETAHAHEESHTQTGHAAPPRQQTLARRLAAIAVPFGVAASPDLTILPVALAASAVGRGAVVGVIVVFALLTMATFIGLTVLATLAGYQIKGEWLERHANTITAVVLIAIGVVAYIGF
jgi:nickel/cobalt exporter